MAGTPMADGRWLMGETSKGFKLNITLRLSTCTLAGENFYKQAVVSLPLCYYLHWSPSPNIQNRHL
jgi:hypothetical protein